VSARRIFPLAVLSAALTAWAAEPVRLRLSNGAEIRGEILRERADSVLIDLGFSVLAVPLDEIAAREAVSPAAAPETQARAEDLYYVETGRDPLPVDLNVERVGGAVVQIQTASGLGSGFIINSMSSPVSARSPCSSTKRPVAAWKSASSPR